MASVLNRVARRKWLQGCHFIVLGCEWISLQYSLVTNWLLNPEPCHLFVTLMREEGISSENGESNFDQNSPKIIRALPEKGCQILCIISRKTDQNLWRLAFIRLNDPFLSSAKFVKSSKI